MIESVDIGRTGRKFACVCVCVVIDRATLRRHRSSLLFSLLPRSCQLGRIAHAQTVIYNSLPYSSCFSSSSVVFSFLTLLSLFFFFFLHIFLVQFTIVNSFPFSSSCHPLGCVCIYRERRGGGGGMVNAVKFLLPLFFFFYFFSRCLRPSSFKDEERRKPRTHKTHSPHTYTHQRTGLSVCVVAVKQQQQ